ncbi:MAG: hypothetical protein PHQ23_15860 [Candidatus Wallbacteria bacterium]|nr:hypothetical protein [Candidatus Wallbacteria bacterium]
MDIDLDGLVSWADRIMNCLPVEIEGGSCCMDIDNEAFNAGHTDNDPICNLFVYNRDGSGKFLFRHKETGHWLAQVVAGDMVLRHTSVRCKGKLYEELEVLRIVSFDPEESCCRTVTLDHYISPFRFDGRKPDLDEQ